MKFRLLRLGLKETKQRGSPLPPPLVLIPSAFLNSCKRQRKNDSKSNIVAGRMIRPGPPACLPVFRTVGPVVRRGLPVDPDADAAPAFVGGIHQRPADPPRLGARSEERRVGRERSRRAG